MTIDSTLFNMESSITNANIVKELILDRLAKDKIITSEQANDYAERWQIILIKKIWYERWANKFKPNGKDSDYYYKLVRFEE